MSYLIVVAHPDDEVLGAGATINKLSGEGHEVNVCILSGNAGARANGLTQKNSTTIQPVHGLHRCQ